MAEETGKVTLAPDERNVVSLVLPAEVRMTVRADDPAEAEAIVRAIFGSGDWRKAMLEMGWKPPRRGVEFAVRLT